MRRLLRDVARCAGKGCGVRDECARYLTHREECFDPKADRHVVYGAFDDEPRTFGCGALIRVEPEDVEPENQPIGNCRKCGIPVYTDEGFCGACGHR